MMLHCNIIPHWLSPYKEWSLNHTPLNSVIVVSCAVYYSDHHIPIHIRAKSNFHFRWINQIAHESYTFFTFPIPVYTPSILKQIQGYACTVRWKGSYILCMQRNASESAFYIIGSFQWERHTEISWSQSWWQQCQTLLISLLRDHATWCVFNAAVRYFLMRCYVCNVFSQWLKLSV